MVCLDQAHQLLPERLAGCLAGGQVQALQWQSQSYVISGMCMLMHSSLATGHDCAGKNFVRDLLLDTHKNEVGPSP